MEDEYDFSKMKPAKNPYASQLKKPISIGVNKDVLDYFKNMAKEEGIPYQTLISLYLRDCASKQKKITINRKK